MLKVTDVIIVGGGASGIAAAIMIKEKSPHTSVTVFESNDRILKKLLTTGNGRCNITNRSFDDTRYHGETPQLAADIISRFPPKMQADFFKKIGVPIVFEPDGKAYPMVYQASAVVDCLRFAAAEAGVLIKINACVTDVKRQSDGFQVTADRQYSCRFLIISAGGQAGGKLGGDGGYMLLKKLGHKINERRPSIVQVKTKGTLARSLKGIKINARVSVISGGNKTAADFGEVLFCDYGLSGPAVMQVSRAVSFDPTALISLDLFPEIETDKLAQIILDRTKRLSARPVSELFTGIMNKRVWAAVLKALKTEQNRASGALVKDEIKRIASALKNFEFPCDGTLGFRDAQVTAGGASTAQFFEHSLMSKKAPGLYATGEVLDIDGDCGGFNLSWCWSSANAVANDILAKQEPQQ